jgi:hypothetical protein
VAQPREIARLTRRVRAGLVWLVLAPPALVRSGVTVRFARFERVARDRVRVGLQRVHHAQVRAGRHPPNVAGARVVDVSPLLHRFAFRFETGRSRTVQSGRKSAALERSLRQLARSFAERLVQALIAARVDELAVVDSVSLPPPRPRRRAPVSRTVTATRSRKRSATPRKSAEALIEDRSRALDGVAELLRDKPTGLRGEQIRAHLRLDKRLFLQAVADGLDVGRLRKTGERRATTYFLAA